jgi:hypothetical protein
MGFEFVPMIHLFSGFIEHSGVDFDLDITRIGIVRCTNSKPGVNAMSNDDPFKLNELFASINPEKMAEQWQEMLQKSPLSKMDVSTISELQRKNAETLIQANQAAVKGEQSLIEKQSRVMQEMISEATQIFTKQGTNPQSSGSGIEPEENVKLVEQAIEKSMSNYSDIVNTMQNTYSEMSDLVEKRMQENLEELKESLSKLSAK